MPRPAKPAPWLDSRNGIFYASWYDAATKRTKRQSLGCRDRRAAEEAFGQWLIARAKPAGRNSEVLVVTVLTDYLTNHLVGRPSFPNGAIYAQHLAEHFGGLTIDEITPAIQDQYLAKRRAAGLKDASIARELTVLKAALTRLWKRREIDHPPHIFLPSGQPVRERALTHEEVGLLLGAAAPHIALYIRLALATAARPSDLLRLTWFQVDLPHRRVHLMKAGEAVSNKRKGVVRISDETAAALDVAKQGAGDSHVIAWQGRPLTRRSLHQAVARLGERVGVAGIYPYIFRHTAATWLARDGVSMHDIAQLLGHSTTRVTERYAKHSPDYMGAATASIDRQLAQAVGRVSLQFRATKRKALTGGEG